MMSQLIAYQFVWTTRDRRGDWEYEYWCLWQDGTVTTEITLPWGNMEGAVEVDDITQKQKEQEVSVASLLGTP